MKRREFLKFSSVSAAALFTRAILGGNILSLPLFVQSGQNWFHGTKAGEIQISKDLGKSWETHIVFDKTIQVKGLSIDYADEVIAHLGYEGFSFNLKLETEGQRWMSI